MPTCTSRNDHPTSPLLKGVSAKTLGIGETNDIGYVQCPDPGKPYTPGGTVVFQLVREPS